MAPKRRRIRIPKEKEDFFANIPEEIMIEILSRLAIPTVMRCKSVCKSWLDMIESPEFSKLHVSKSARGLALDEDGPHTLALYRGKKSSKPYKILKLVDSEDSGNHCNVVFKFNFPYGNLSVHGSADGLLLLRKYGSNRHLFICNPITREYIKLPPSPRPSYSIYNTFGIGVSKLTGKYKVVSMFDGDTNFAPKSAVYTLGMGSWRSVPVGVSINYVVRSLGVFLNGNLHWLGLKWNDQNGYSLHTIVCFDLETECFSTFSCPYRPHYLSRNLCRLGQSLCMCYHNLDYVFDIWLMNKYGDDQSWEKVYCIKVRYSKRPGGVVPIKIFKNGDILLANQFCPKLCCYLSKTRTTREVDLTKRFAGRHGIRPSIYNPSFLSLKTFAMENVSSF